MSEKTKYASFGLEVAEYIRNISTDDDPDMARIYEIARKWDVSLSKGCTEDF